MEHKEEKREGILYEQTLDMPEKPPALKNLADQKYLEFIEHRDNYQYFPYVQY